MFGGFLFALQVWGTYLRKFTVYVHMPKEEKTYFQGLFSAFTENCVRKLHRLQIMNVTKKFKLLSKRLTRARNARCLSVEERRTLLNLDV